MYEYIYIYEIQNKIWKREKEEKLIVYLIIINRFYIALFSALEQTHCARVWFYMSEEFL